MRKYELLFVLVTGFLLIFCPAVFAAAPECKYQEVLLQGEGKNCEVLVQFYPGMGKSWTSLIETRKDGTWVKFLQNPRPVEGLVEAQVVPEFFGVKKDAVTFKKYEGSSPCFMDYSVCFLNGNDLKAAKAEQGISRGNLIADGNILQLWSGVRMWLLYCPEARSVVKDFVPWLVVQKVGDEVGDRIVEFRIEDGEVIFANPSILGEGLRIKSGHDLTLQRTDFNSQGEKVEFIGEITMNVKYPNTFTILSGDCEICIMPDDNPLQEKRFRLVVE